MLSVLLEFWWFGLWVEVRAFFRGGLVLSSPGATGSFQWLFRNEHLIFKARLSLGVGHAKTGGKMSSVPSTLASDWGVKKGTTRNRGEPM